MFDDIKDIIGKTTQDMMEKNKKDTIQMKMSTCNFVLKKKVNGTNICVSGIDPFRVKKSFEDFIVMMTTKEEKNG